MSASYVPAIKSRMGDWAYYVTKMTFGDVVSQVEPAEKIHTAPELDRVIQRELGQSVSEMTDFLLNEEQRFYGSLVVTIHKGNPEFIPITIDDKSNLIDKADHSLGLLWMDGSQTYYALDGQHRLASIKMACDKNPDLKQEEISVLVLKHENTKEGMIRTRRLFTKLNRYAKATDAKTNIVLDEDDCVAINTRRMIREFAPFKKRIKVTAAGKQIGTGEADAEYLATLSGLYEANMELAKSFNGGHDMDKDFLRKRPENEFLDDLYGHLCEIWDALIEGVPTLKSALTDKKPGMYRLSDGGDVWVRPIGQHILAEFVRHALNDDADLKDVVSYVKKIPSDLAGEPWVNVIWNPDTKKIIGARAERTFMVEALCSSSGLAKSNWTPEGIMARYGEYHKSEPKTFPSY